MHALKLIALITVLAMGGLIFWAALLQFILIARG